MMRRLLLVLFTVAAVFTVGASSAHAIDIPTGTDCLHPPPPASPTGGLAGWIDPGPDNPPAGDPFAPGATVTIYSQYGYAGLTPVEYDPGCTSIWSWNQIAAGFSMIAATWTAVTVRLYRTVMTGTFGSLFDGIQQVAGRAFGHGLFIPLIGFGVACTGIYLLARSRRADFAGQARMGVTSLLIVAAGVGCVLYPVTIGNAVDEGVTNTINDVNALILPDAAGTDTGPGRAADMVAANLHASILWQTWRQQTFGPDGTAAADEFGPRLFVASAFSRSEQAAISQDPTTALDAFNRKQDEYKTVAAEVKAKYPQAYVHLAGGDTLTTAGLGGAGLLSVMVATWFLLYALWRFAYALIIARVGLAVAPIVALVAQFPRYQSTAMALLGAVVSAAVSAIVMGVAAVAYLVAGIGVILSPDTAWHPVLKVLAMAALTVVMLRLLRRLGLAGKRKKKVGKKGKDSKASKSSKSSKVTSSTGTPADPAPRTVQGSRVKVAAQGAASGAKATAVKTAAVGAATGGTVTAGALAAGAAKGAAAGATTSTATSRTGSAAPVHRPSSSSAVSAAPSRPAISAGTGSTPPARTADDRARVIQGQTIFHPTRGSGEPPGPKRATGTSTVDGVPVHRVTTMKGDR